MICSGRFNENLHVLCNIFNLGKIFRSYCCTKYLLVLTPSFYNLTMYGAANQLPNSTMFVLTLLYTRTAFFPKPYFYRGMWGWNRALPCGYIQGKENVGSLFFISLSFQSLDLITAFAFAEALVSTKGKEQSGPWLCTSDLANTGGTARCSLENMVTVFCPILSLPRSFPWSSVS